MLIIDLKDCQTFTSGDGAELRELLNPRKMPLDLCCSLAHATVKPGDTTIPHRLKTSEVYYIIAGKGLLHIDEESSEVSPGQAVYIPPNSVQYIQSTGDIDLVFLCIVDPAWQAQDEEILPI